MPRGSACWCLCSVGRQDEISCPPDGLKCHNYGISTVLQYQWKPFNSNSSLGPVIKQILITVSANNASNLNQKHQPTTPDAHPIHSSLAQTLLRHYKHLCFPSIELSVHGWYLGLLFSLIMDLQMFLQKLSGIGKSRHSPRKKGWEGKFIGKLLLFLALPSVVRPAASPYDSQSQGTVWILKDTMANVGIGQKKFSFPWSAMKQPSIPELYLMQEQRPAFKSHFKGNWQMQPNNKKQKREIVY